MAGTPLAWYEPARYDPVVNYADEARPPQGEPAVILELASACREYVERALGVALDDTPETLPVLDHYLRISQGSIAEKPDLFELIVRTSGAYFGELVCHHLDGFWWQCSDDMGRWLVCARPVFLAINPFAVAREALRERVEAEGPSAQLRVAPDCRAAVEARLSRLPAVAEHDYYLLSTRLEALEIAAEASRAVRLQNEPQPQSFGCDDYERPRPGSD